MSAASPMAGLLADIVHDTAFGNRWHRLAEATSDLTDDDLSYRPIPAVGRVWDRGGPSCIMAPGPVLRHIAEAAAWYGDGLAPRTADASEDQWGAVDLSAAARRADTLVATVDAALRRLHARAAAVTEEQLFEPSHGVWDDTPKVLVLIDGAILHTAWHLGQVAMAPAWHRAQQEAEINRPPAPPAGPMVYPGEPVPSELRLASRRDVCLQLLRTAYRDGTCHALRRTLEGLTCEELYWSPFPGAHCPLMSLHVAACKVMYADHAFGARNMTWEDCDRVVACQEKRLTADQVLAGLDRAQQFLVEHVAAATDENLDRVSPMHHGVPHTGWQVVASMAQHDAWHAGQIAIMREVYEALAQEAQG